jgi:hypothetical protein
MLIRIILFVSFSILEFIISKKTDIESLFDAFFEITDLDKTIKKSYCNHDNLILTSKVDELSTNIFNKISGNLDILLTSNGQIVNPKEYLKNKSKTKKKYYIEHLNKYNENLENLKESILELIKRGNTIYIDSNLPICKNLIEFLIKLVYIYSETLCEDTSEIVVKRTLQRAINNSFNLLNKDMKTTTPPPKPLHNLLMYISNNMYDYNSISKAVHEFMSTYCTEAL